MKKKTTTSTALAIPQTITPKPTKNDIINAMVERARVKHAGEELKFKQKHAEITAKIEKAAMAEFNRNRPSPNYTIQGWGENKRVELEFRIATPAITALIQELNNLWSPRNFDETEVRRKIREGMSNQTGNAVQALLANPDAVKALDASLDHIGM